MLSDKRGAAALASGWSRVLRVPLPQDCGFFVGTGSAAVSLSGTRD